MAIYLQLFAAALVPVALSILFYLLLRKTPFGKLSFWAQQIIIGIVFGGAAVLGTEWGVDIGGATANARDAAPLCAGLLFGAPAGIIAGVIGGVERWFAVLWGAGAYSRVACSLSTVLAGLYAAALRKFMFDDKRPTWGFGLATGIVMEVLHLSLLFMTHFTDAEKAYHIVEITTGPMVLCNALSVMLSIIAVSLFSKNINHTKSDVRTISQKVQSAMLVCVGLAYLFTTTFVYILQTNTAIASTQSLMSLNLTDARNEVDDSADEDLMNIAKKIAHELDERPYTDINSLAVKYDISELHVVSHEGIIIDGTWREVVGFDFNSGDQSREFMALTRGKSVMVQDFMPISFGEQNGETIYRKYAGAAMVNGKFVQVGYDEEAFVREYEKYVKDITNNRHLGKTGYLLIADANGNIVSGDDGIHETMEDYRIKIDETTPEMTLLTGKILGENCSYMYTKIMNSYIIGVYPNAEAYASRDASAYVNSFMEVLVFALLFALIYSLIKKLVVNNIRNVNKNLEEIIGGNLDVKVDVHSSREFSSLSDDINSTVTTLKHYIAEAAARIDKELEFARNIQTSALPSVDAELSDVKELSMGAAMFTAKAVGGDFYDIYKLDDDKVAFLIADVSGKGIPAAMFMMRAKTMIRNFAEEGLPVNEIFTRANNKLCEGNDAGMFVTAWMGIIDRKTGHITFANAGHNPPLIYRKGEKYEYLTSRPGFVLAGMDGVNYKMQEFDLHPGDKFYLYTDGVTEATDAHNCLYGEPRLNETLNAHTDADEKETLSIIKNDIDDFVGEAEQFDDITMVTLHYKGIEETKMAEKVFPATDESLADAQSFIEAELEKADCGMKTAMQISVALEELFVNVAHYAYGEGTGDVKLSIGISDGVATISLTDSGMPFDPLAKVDPDITLSADDRQIGGLGIFMVKKTMDSVSYKYENGQNILTIKKKIS